MSAYVFDGRWCFSCNFRRNEYRHLKQCVPQRYWPPESEWADNQPRVERLPQRIGIYPRSVYERAFPAVMERPRVISDQTTRVEPDDPSLPELDEINARLTSAAMEGVNRHVGAPHGSRGDSLTIRAYAPPDISDEEKARILATICECGYTVPATSKNPPAAMRLHRAKSKAHKHA